ncbi:MAG TPA: hypothetical protein DD387_05730 [Lachnoclostridium sp.]|nr:hypothetical protein [Lachnoclostridium sp.]
MVTLHEGKQYIVNNDHIATAEEAAKLSAEEGKKQTLTYQVLEKHNHSVLCHSKTDTRNQKMKLIAGIRFILQNTYQKSGRLWK